jgi:pyruvate dehydrogenase E2 component (dihydrolipoamide acetyltransferase)
MATKVMMEALSPTMEEGRLVKWLKSEGDAVNNGDVLAEVETDKAIMELVARGSGVLRKRLIAEDVTAPVGQLIGVIATADENIDALVGGASGAASAAPAPGTPAPSTSAPTTSVPSTSAPTTSVPSSAVPAPGAPSSRTLASPLARRIAAEKGVSLDRVQGSGPGGRVVLRDVESLSASAPQTAAPTVVTTVVSTATRPTVSAPRMVIDGDYKDVTLTQMRKTIARRLGESIGPIPTFYLTSEIDMTAVSDLRADLANGKQPLKVSVNDIILKAVATALVHHPECNAHWLGESIRYHARVHVGMAVATDDGLIVPVIRDAHVKGLGAIGAESRDLAGRARERKLTPEEYSGSTFSVSNLGMFGIDQFTAIINPPEVAILAVGGTETKPVYVDGALVPRQRMRVTLSCDHRVIDGAVGARFLETLKGMLENPIRMLV